MAEKASQVSGTDKSSSCPLYSEKKKSDFFDETKTIKI